MTFVFVYVLFFQAGAVCLHAAAKRGHVAVVKSLLTKGSLVDATTKVYLIAKGCGFGSHPSNMPWIFLNRTRESTEYTVLPNTHRWVKPKCTHLYTVLVHLNGSKCFLIHEEACRQNLVFLFDTLVSSVTGTTAHTLKYLVGNNISL